MIKKYSIFIVVLLMQHITTFADIFAGLQPVKIATNMQFTEGPSWHPNGYLIFSDINGNVIYRWSESSGLDTLVYPAGNPNGTDCSKKNDFVVCRHTNHDVARMDTNGVITSIVSQYKGNRLNSPNDAVFSYLGSIYFTDPDYGVAATDKQLRFEGVYCIPYNSSRLILLDSTLVKPNGVTFSLDWRTLYVCESSTNNIYSYTFRNDTILQDITKDKKLFVKVPGTGEIDGMTSDVWGNLFVAFGDGGIKIINKEAKEIGSISFPAGEKVRNMCFGGKYKNILFVTAGTSLYKIEIRYFGDLIATGLLGVPTDKSVVFNAVSDKTLDTYIAYGTSPINVSQQTTTSSFQAGVPIEIELSGLSANTRYYYTLFYKQKSASSFTSATSGTFITQRASGETFSFAIEADPHLDEGSNYTTFRNMLKNAADRNSDFLIDLGDNFLTEKFPIDDRYYIEQRNLLYRNFWDSVCKSMPLFIVQGNHEGELGWLSNNSATDIFNTTTAVRKLYYPTPEPDDFYTGSSIVDQFVGKRENYYSWNWGDALFVVIDPYAYTLVRTNNPWCFTLGKTQYDWFRQTLETSKAKYKFVFAHQLVGGDNLGRGGVEVADYFENGGNNADGSYGFDDLRSGWGKPLHQIMKENGVQIYFHGHDHFYAKQEKDGIIYQEVPQPSFPGYTVVNDASTYGYLTGEILPNSGHLQVSILGDSAKVEYIGGYHSNDPKNNLINGQVRTSYYVKSNQLSTSVNELKTASAITAYQSGNFIFVRTETAIEASIIVYSVNGQAVFQIKDGSLSMGTNSFELPETLPKGIYFIKVQNQNTNITLKTIKL